MNPLNKDVWRRGLLVGGIVSSVLYATMVVVSAQLWPAYRSTSQTISELSAIGAPTRPMWVGLGVAYTLLITGFGWAVWASALDNRRLRTAGGLILAYGALGVLWPFAPMHSREVLAAGGGTWNDSMHLGLASLTVILMLAAIVFGSVSLGRGFRVYSIASLVILGTCGALTFREAPQVGANLPTPWIGVWQRINVGAFLVWVVALATALLQTRVPQHDRRKPSGPRPAHASR